MSESRSFSPDDLPKKKEDYHGAARYKRIQPEIKAEDVPSANLYLDFDEALRLSVAIQSCIMNLNKLNRATSAGKDMGLLLSIKLASNSISVIETPIEGSRKTKKK